MFGHTDGSLSVFQPGTFVFLDSFTFDLNTFLRKNMSLMYTFIVLFCSGSKGQKHVLRPESLEGTDEEDPVSALEWDLLSTDYLLGWTKY